MISISWKFDTLYIIQCVPEKETYNSDFVINTMFPNHEDVIRTDTKISEIILYCNNTKPHKSD